MKAIHYILICCLLGLIGCSKRERCHCTVVYTINGIEEGNNTTHYMPTNLDACSGYDGEVYTYTDSIGVHLTTRNNCFREEY